MFKPASNNDTALALARETRKLGIVVERLIRRDAIFAHPAKYLLFSFLNGFFIFLGSTFGVALFLWILNIMGYLPFIGDFAETVRDTIGR